MSILELIFLSIALAMDCFAVSFSAGGLQKELRLRHALIIGSFFGLFQGFMPLIGYFGGQAVVSYIERFAQLGVKYLSVHYEACNDRHLKDCIKQIHELGMYAGVAINPETPAEVLIPWLRQIDYVVVMGVHPG